MTRLAPHTIALRDQIVSAVENAFPAPITSNEIAALLPPIVCSLFGSPCSFWCGLNARGPREIEILECHRDEFGEWHLIRRPRSSQDIQRHLTGLWREGRIVKLPYNRSANPCTRWTVAPDAASVQDLVALNASWSES
ncbi:hypothetical protein JF729_07080 [Mycobacterium intracellulare]|uniref:hypothetical protein n=1 Tax=Mycobacterium intracellulare TaxID=1767 RepID=UPI001CDA1CF5|nr:hypothetical protein [Mycobacterium intracellulare]MCA2247559.1 hypothetical protein [Mycobacterium intracellulare]